MYGRHLFAVAALMLVSIPILANAQVDDGLLHFGGSVVWEVPCDDGLLLTVEQFTGPQYFMWNYGELPYLMFVPPHIGQNLIGAADYVPSECWLGDEYMGYGFPIVGHGESF